MSEPTAPLPCDIDDGAAVSRFRPQSANTLLTDGAAFAFRIIGSAKDSVVLAERHSD